MPFYLSEVCVMKPNTERPSSADPAPDAPQTLPDPTQKWQFISNLHPLSIVFVIIVLFALLTYGQNLRHPDEKYRPS